MATITINEPKKEELRKNGTSKNIQTKEGLTVQKLLDYGFTNHHDPTYYYCRMVGDEISFNVSIDKKTLKENVKIDVLDEDFCQPFDYQRMILEGKVTPLVSSVYERVEEEMAKLQEAGILIGHIRGNYI